MYCPRLFLCLSLQRKERVHARRGERKNLTQPVPSDAAWSREETGGRGSNSNTYSDPTTQQPDDDDASSDP